MERSRYAKDRRRDSGQQDTTPNTAAGARLQGFHGERMRQQSSPNAYARNSEPTWSPSTGTRWRNLTRPRQLGNSAPKEQRQERSVHRQPRVRHCSVATSLPSHGAMEQACWRARLSPSATHGAPESRPQPNLVFSPSRRRIGDPKHQRSRDATRVAGSRWTPRPVCPARARHREGGPLRACFASTYWLPPTADIAPPRPPSI
jgi:hypothetical protein